MRFYIIRHGQTNWNKKGKIQGKTDIELNEEGIEQAKEVRKILEKYPIDVIVSSPLKRARKTAEIINKETNLHIIIDERISERYFGEFEGMSTMDFDFNAFWSYKQNNKYNKAENIRVFFKRVYDFLDDIKEKYKGKKILIVSHGGISIPIKCYFNGIPDIDTLLPLCIDNCEVASFNYADRDKLKD